MEQNNIAGSKDKIIVLKLLKRKTSLRQPKLGKRRKMREITTGKIILSQRKIPRGEYYQILMDDETTSD